MQKPKILLLDSHAVLHRSYHAMPYMMTQNGLHSGAVFGFVKAIFQSAKIVYPDYIIAAYDLGGQTFRHLVYEDYKSNRKKTNMELISQIEDSKNFCKALNIKVVSVSGYEADDCIGSICKKYKNQFDIFILTSDMDIMQLIDDDNNVKVLYLKSLKDETILDSKAVFCKYNFYPKDIIDYKALVGDTSDNIKGISGIGDKTAITIINNFKTLDNLYNILESQKENDIVIKDQFLTKKVQEKLLNGKSDAYFSRELATIYQDLDIDLNSYLCDFNFWSDDTNKNILEYQSLCDKYELRSQRNLFYKKASDQDYIIKEDLEDDIVLQINIDGLESNSDNNNITAEDTDQSLYYKDLENSTNEAQFSGILEDIRICNALLNSEKSKSNIEEIFSINNIQKNNKLSEKSNILLLRDILESKLKKEGIFDYYINFEQPSKEVVNTMFRNGITIDKSELHIQQNFVKEQILMSEKIIYQLAGEEFLISSPKQLSSILYDKLGLFSDNKKQVKKTSTGERSTNSEMLERLKDEHPIIPQIIKWRELSKIYNTYLLPLETFVQADDKIHPEFNQLGASTGRWSCENPNLQNLPANSEIGKRVRNIFVAQKNYKIVSLDYSQIDLRSAAILSGDENLIDIFKNDLDVHSAVAARILNKELSQITSQERNSAKAINFGILYGMGVNSLSQSMNSDKATAKEFYDNYKRYFSTLMLYLENVKLEAKSKGYTETLFGRKREIPTLFSPIPFVRAQGERIAINAPIQGTSADIIKKGAIDILSNLKEDIDSDNVRLLLQVHDELVFEIKNDNQDNFEKNILNIKSLLENVLVNNINLIKDYNGQIKDNIIPLKVSVHIGDNLGQVK